jgi:hypothetical protein
MELQNWFVDTAALAAAVVAVVAFLKEHVIKSLAGPATILASLAVGAALGAAGHYLGYLSGGLTPALSFGVAAGFLASGGWDAVKALGKR